MGETRWSIFLSGTVAAETEAVVAWWFHPDRGTEFLDGAEGRGALDVTITRARKDAGWETRLQYRSAQGWEFDHRLEIDLDDHRMPPRRGDRYVADSRDVETAHRGRSQFTVRCVAVQDFVTVQPGNTRITATHQHTMTGGTWLWRWQRRRRDYLLHDRSFRNKIAQCERSLTPSEGTPPTT